MKTPIVKIIAVISIIFLVTGPGLCQNTPQEKLKKDLVKIVDNNYTIEEFMLISIGEQQFQIKTSASAPVDVISRDNFISIYSSNGTVVLLSLFEGAGFAISDLDMKELDELIGQPDITVNIIMTKNGIQMQMITDDGTDRYTSTWDEILGS